MYIPSSEHKELYKKALEYDRAGDIYNAVKLYKKVAKSCPQWFRPFERLGLLYKSRQDWKAALYYNKKTVSLNPGNQSAWWNLGIAATAMKRWRIAKNVWTKFGLPQPQPSNKGRASVRLAIGRQFEIVEVRLIDPARAMITSIPFPGADRRYRDIILYDRDIAGFYRNEETKLPVYEELGLLKRSVYQTASCWLYGASEADLKKLEDLCRQYKMGFEIWSNAQLSSSRSGAGMPEYHHLEQLNPSGEEAVWVAMAAKSIPRLRSVLDSWEVICLKSYSDLKLHN